jgi:hypothetical protein
MITRSTPEESTTPQNFTRRKIFNKKIYRAEISEQSSKSALCCLFCSSCAEDRQHREAYCVAWEPLAAALYIRFKPSTLNKRSPHSIASLCAFDPDESQIDSFYIFVLFDSCGSLEMHPCSLARCNLKLVHINP